jgi:hypothetical protein
MYAIDSYQALFRNDSTNIVDNRRPYSGTSVYSEVPFVHGYPRINNINGVEFTIRKVANHEDCTVIGVYRSPHIGIRQFCMALNNILAEYGADKTVILGDFNVNWMASDQRQPLYNVMIEDNSYQQLISSPTTDYNTLIDHVYTNITDEQITVDIFH